MTISDLLNKTYTECSGMTELQVREYLKDYTRKDMLQMLQLNDRNGVYTDEAIIEEYPQAIHFNSLAIATAYLVASITGIDYDWAQD